MSTVMYVEGTIISGGNELRIYVKSKYWSKLKPYVGKSVKMIMVIEDEDS